LSGVSEVCAADEVLVDLGARDLVEAKALPPRATEGRAWAERQLHSAFQPQPARGKLCQRPIEIGDPVQEHRRVAGEVIGEHQSRAAGLMATSATRVPIDSMAKTTRAPSTSR
jgi:hypothetical protein